MMEPGKKKNKKITHIVPDYRQLRHLPQSALLEESGSPKLILLVVLITAFICISFIIWASLTYVDEVATASGEIQPVNKIHEVQHLEGGIISEVLVENGDAVKEGDILLKLSPTAALSELERSRSRQLSLAIDLQRLHAYIDAEPLTEQQLYKRMRLINDSIDKFTLDNLVADSIELLDFQNKSRKQDLQILQLQINQRQQELDKLKQQHENLQEDIVLLREEQKIYKELEKLESVAKVTVLNSTRALNNAYGEHSETGKDIERAQQALEEAKKRLSARQSQLRRDALQEVAEKNALLHEVTTSIKRLHDKVKRLDVKATDSGIVKGLELNYGSVVLPGENLLEIVPLQQELVVEANLQTIDIGHVRVGDRANVKVTTFDFIRYGQIQGFVDSISPSTFLGEDGRPFYRVVVKLDRLFVGADPSSNRLIPGMVTTVDIITGNKSLLNYFLKPIHRSLQEAFRER